MNGFSDVLAETASRLTVPEPARSRILLELAADMGDLYAAYMDRGRSEAQARAAVLEHFDLSDESLRELVRVHDTPLQGMLNGLSSQARSRWERLVLGVVVVGVTIALGRAVFQGGLLASASFFVWPVFAGGALALGVGAVRIRGLFWPGTSGLRNPSRGVSLILGLAGIEVFLGFTGVWIELYRTALRLTQAPGESLVLLVGWLELASATLTLTLSIALATTLLWFLVAGQAGALERQRAALLVKQ
ncbi:hypothetical protein ACFL3S_06985 [Gemmatimonadota bacterium]